MAISSTVTSVPGGGLQFSGIAIITTSGKLTIHDVNTYHYGAMTLIMLVKVNQLTMIRCKERDMANN